VFEIETRDGQVVLRGNNGVSIASGLLVSTTIPSKTGVVQAVCRPLAFSTETTHIRHAPTLLKTGWWHRVGMVTPA